MTAGYGDLVERITQARFRPVRVREGYAMSEVDDLLDRVVAALGRGESASRVLDRATLSRVRLREGYAIDEVDAFLDSIRRSLVEAAGAEEVPS